MLVLAYQKRIEVIRIGTLEKKKEMFFLIVLQ